MSKAIYRWAKAGKHKVRTRQTPNGFTASVMWYGSKHSMTSVLGLYEDHEAAVDAGRTVIAGMDVPRLNTPRDIAKHRRECPKELWTKPSGVKPDGARS